MKRVIPPPLYWQEARGHYEEDMSAGIPWVCHRAGKRVLDYNQAWRKALADSGMSGRGIRMYDIRHVAASEMLAAGADLPAVSAQLGHASRKTTFDGPRKRFYLPKRRGPEVRQTPPALYAGSFSGLPR